MLKRVAVKIRSARSPLIKDREESGEFGVLDGIGIGFWGLAFERRFREGVHTYFHRK
jgi:hypothetical protein